MSMKKITEQDAKHIAHQIAVKAFEHNLLPLLIAQREVAKKYYDAELVVLGLDEATLNMYVDRDIIPNIKHSAAIVTFSTKLDESGDEDEDHVRMNLGLQHRYRRYPGIDADDFGHIEGRYDDAIEHDEKLFRNYPIRMLCVRSPQAVADIKARQKQIDVYQKRADKMERELAINMKARTCKEVMAQWPEATPFIVKHFSLDVKKPEMDTPLENLLGRYLSLPEPQLALPA